MQLNTIESKDIAETADQYLTFLLGDEEYGVEILKVQEIKSWGPYSRLPNAPDYLLGVINLRGAIVPIIDLRKRFSLPTIPYTATTATIIVHIEEEEQIRVVGLVVDRVADVYHLSEDAIQDSAVLTGSENPNFIRGLGQIDGKMVILVNLEPIVASSLQTIAGDGV
ncbi:MAG: chemotaxis protein CheW [Granulosicoccaceae bacterium]